MPWLRPGIGLPDGFIDDAGGDMNDPSRNHRFAPVFDDVAFLATEFREGQDETDPATGSTLL